jgi:hypothetical protein
MIAMHTIFFEGRKGGVNILIIKQQYNFLHTRFLVLNLFLGTDILECMYIDKIAHYN